MENNGRGPRLWEGCPLSVIQRSRIPIPILRRPDPAYEHSDERKRQQHPNQPRKAFEGVQLSAVDEHDLRAAIKRASERLGDCRSCCEPQDPRHRQATIAMQGNNVSTAKEEKGVKRKEIANISYTISKFLRHNSQEEMRRHTRKRTPCCD